MLRFALTKNHPFYGDEVRVIGDCEALGWWEDESWGKDLFGPASTAAPPVGEDLTASLLVHIGKTTKFSFIAIRKDEVVYSEHKEVTISDGIWRLTDDGNSGEHAYRLEKDESWCAPQHWPGTASWKVFDAILPTESPFALRGPVSGIATTLLVYFHPAHGRLDKAFTSVFRDKTAPPALVNKCLENAAILMPGCPVLLKDGNEVASGYWVGDNNRVRSEPAGERLYALIERVRMHYAIEPNCVVAYGTSNGGYAVLEMMGQFPSLFTKAAAISAHMEKPVAEVAAKIPHVPLYLWHCINDVVCSSGDMVDLASLLQEENKPVEIWMGKDLMNHKGHTAASHNAIDAGMIEWLFDIRSTAAINKRGRISVSLLRSPRPSFIKRAYDSHSRWSDRWVDDHEHVVSGDKWDYSSGNWTTGYGQDWNENKSNWYTWESDATLDNTEIAPVATDRLRVDTSKAFRVPFFTNFFCGVVRIEHAT